jgi:hypothetical protein
MKPTIFDAVHFLVGGGMSGESDVFESIDYKEEQTPPSKEEAENKLTELIAEYDAQAYARNRASEYPSLLELTVALYDTDDKSAVEAKRASVKLKYPKPS